MTQPRVSIPRWLFGTALTLPVALVVAVLVAAAVVRGQRPGPLHLADVPAPAAGSADCTRLLAALPDELSGPDAREGGELHRRPSPDPAPSGSVTAGPGSAVAAWGEPPVILRCGLDRPAELTAGSRLLDVSGVQFLQLSSREAGVTNWVAVDRAVYVMVTLPAGTGSGPMQELSGMIADTMARQGMDLTP